MERKISNALSKWKDSKNRMPLIISGARQVGKTFSVLEFANDNYKNVIYVNFESNSEVSQIFERDLNPDRILYELSVLYGQTILKYDTLIFFDEIQTCEKALTSLKYFQEELNEYHIIAAGSILGVAIKRERFSFPVGKVQMITLYPLDFEEFLWAIEKKELSGLIRESFIANTQLSLHNTTLAYYRYYLVIGGMPGAVREYSETHDLNRVLAVQINISNAYIADMAKYATPAETIKIMTLFRSIPSQLAKENHKFQYKQIKTGARAQNYESSLEWLISSGIIIRCVKVTEARLPLTAYVQNTSFKIYMADTGLLCSSFGIPAVAILSQNPHLDYFKGALTENYVCSSIVMNGHVPYYWESSGRAEIDFLIQNQEGEIIPIEVKSSDNVRSKSLSIFIEKYHPIYSIRVSTKNFGFDSGIRSIPLYALFCLDKSDHYL